MAEDSKMVYQFKITLQDLHPPIWRRIQVPSDYNFRMLHAAIQDSMGWCDSHLHYFRVKNQSGSFVTIGNLEGEDDDFCGLFGSRPKVLCEENTKLSKYFKYPKAKARYEYDMGDFWVHDVVLEKILPADDGPYPRCTEGKRACPPEDCGGTSGYERLIEILRNPSHPEHADQKEWLGIEEDSDFDPEKFDPKEVRFFSCAGDKCCIS